MPPSPEISLRPGTNADIPTLVSISLAAFGHDDIIAQTLFPPPREPDAIKRKEDESAWRASRMPEDMSNPQKSYVAAYVGDERGTEVEDTACRSEEPREHIIGFAVWERPDDVASVAQLVDSRTGSTSRDTIIDADRTMPDSQDQHNPWSASLDTGALEKLKKISADGARSVLGEKGTSNMWSLNVIAVNPEHQRKGVGKMLVTWGVEKARQDGKDIYLASMPAGRSLYISCGFHEVGEMDVFGVTQYHMLLKVSS